jgi:hypothetical protein
MKLRICLVAFTIFYSLCFAQEKVQYKVNWKTVSIDDMCSMPKPADPPVKFTDLEDVDSRDDRKLMCYQAFVESLNNLTYCYPDIKSGYLMGLNQDSRDKIPIKSGNNSVCKLFEDITYGESIIPKIPVLKYKFPRIRESNRGDHTGNVTINLKWEYVAVDRFDSVYSRLSFEYKNYEAKFTGCHCLFGNTDRGIKTFDKVDCSIQNAKGFDCFYFKPEGFEDEIIDATIYIYPLIFQTDYFYFTGGPGEWVESRQRALMILFLHELGHFEQHIAQYVKLGKKISVGEGESFADTFAWSVLNCVE